MNYKSSPGAVFSINKTALRAKHKIEELEDERGKIMAELADFYVNLNSHFTLTQESEERERVTKLSLKTLFELIKAAIYKLMGEVEHLKSQQDVRERVLRVVDELELGKTGESIILNMDGRVEAIKKENTRLKKELEVMTKSYMTIK